MEENRALKKRLASITDTAARAKRHYRIEHIVAPATSEPTQQHRKTTVP